MRLRTEADLLEHDEAFNLEYARNLRAAIRATRPLRLVGTTFTYDSRQFIGYWDWRFIEGGMK